MSNDQIVVLMMTAIVMVVVLHARKEFTRGYRMALDHVEQMTRPDRLTTTSLDASLKKLRDETKS